MADELIFYTNPMSRGRIVRWMLEELGATYRTEVLEYGTTMKAPEYRALNPMGKVPAIVHDGKVVTESAAICAYLAAAFPAAGLAPKPAERAAFYRWLFFFAGPFESAVVDRSLGFVVPEDKQRRSGYGSFEVVMDTVEHELGSRPYIAGDRFTAADVYCGSHVGWGMQFGSIDKRPAFEAYWSRLAERPALRRAEELDDALATKPGS